MAAASGTCSVYRLTTPSRWPHPVIHPTEGPRLNPDCLVILFRDLLGAANLIGSRTV